MTSVKKNLTTLGYVTINNNHGFNEGHNGFQISPRMQELMVYAGQMDSYDNCNEIIKSFTNIEVSAAQVYRLTDLYGHEVGKQAVMRILEPLKQQEVLYVQADGSMILTRDNSWSEVKLGRIFKSSDCLHPVAKQGWISNSQYVAHLGNHKKFCRQMDDLIDDFGPLKQRLVFITDGAPWLGNWIEDSFAQSISVLDFYHATEHLHAFCAEVFKDKQLQQHWFEQQKELLLESRLDDAIQNISQQGRHKSKEVEKLISYYNNNRDRMNYKKYHSIGCGIIGSGAIESAHRTVIQKRMKQSGQRWSTPGAQNMLNLRVVRKNQQWSKIVELAKTNFKQAA